MSRRRVTRIGLQVALALIATGATAAIAPTAAAAPAVPRQGRGAIASCHRITWDGVAALFDRWNASLGSGDVQQVVANYAPDAVLMPAFSNAPRAGRDAIREYFAALMQLNPRSRVVQRTIKIRCNVGLDAGVLALRLKNATGGDAMLTTRFSFVYEYRDGRWLIAHDHASVVPTGDAEPVATLAPPSASLNADSAAAATLAPTHLVIPVDAPPAPGADNASPEASPIAPPLDPTPADAQRNQAAPKVEATGH